MRRNVPIYILLALVLAVSIGSAQTEKDQFPPVPATLMQAELTGLEGKKCTLDDFRGKVILVNLWAVWCGPCREQMPDLSKLQEEYASAGLEVIGINVGDHDLQPEDGKKIKTFGDQYDLNYRLTESSLPAYTDLCKITKAQVVPQTILIDRDGRLRAVWAGSGQSIDSQIKLLVKAILSTAAFRTVDNVPNDYLMEKTVRIILRSEIKPSDKPRIVYIADTNIEAAWLPEIKGVNFVLLNKEEQKGRGGFQFLRPHHFRIEFVNWMSYGCGGKGSVWSIEQPHDSDVRVLRSPIELIHPCGLIDPHKK